MRDLTDALPDATTRAAYLYHVLELNQAEVAARLGVSRATVHNLLREARARGLVRISLSPTVLSQAAAARDLAAAYGLEMAIILPDADRADGALRAGAAMIDDLIPKGATLGVAWGETIYRLAQHVPPGERPDVTVVQMVGSMASPHGFNAEDCSSLIAQRLGAACVNLHAPAVLTDPAIAEVLRREPVIARQLETLARCDAALFPVGLATRESHIVRSGVTTPEVLDDYLARGAAAVVAGRFVDTEGAAMSGPMDGRFIGIEPETLRAIPLRIVIAVGAERSAAVAAALRGGFATHLIADEACIAGMAVGA
ncbi:MarR family transcriptional regulator [Jannaschia sp.]|nr:MarR family transcriptional regulator [Jannaschia sp.]